MPRFTVQLNIAEFAPEEATDITVEYDSETHIIVIEYEVPPREVPNARPR